MKKILLIPEFGAFGGTRTYFIQLLSFYKKYNYNVSIAMNANQLSLLRDIKIDDYTVFLIPEFKYFPKIFKKFPFSFFLDFLKILRIYLLVKPNIIVASIGTPGLFLGLFLLPSKLVYILHTYPFFSEHKFSKVTFFKKLFISFFLSSKKIILTVSFYSKYEICRFWITSNKEKYVYVVHNTAGAPLNPEPKLQSENIEQVNILTLGHVVWYKDPETWFQVAEKVISSLNSTNINFIWAGNGDQYHAFLRRAQSSVYYKNIHFIGFQADVEPLFRKADIYFQPSLIESHGLSVLEAMRFGVPSIVSLSGGLPESIDNYKNGFHAVSKDVNDMSEKIIKLIESREQRNEMRLACLIKYKKCFSKEKWEMGISQFH